MSAIGGRLNPECVAIPAEGSANARIVSAMRVILTLAALASSYADPDDYVLLAPLAHSIVIIYAIYSATIYLLVSRTNRQLPDHILHWIDVAWCTLLVAMTGGSSSIFFFYYFFAIITASFNWGFAMGMYTAVASALLQASVSILVVIAGGPLDLGRFMLRPFLLLGLGLILAHWGHTEIRLKRRLSLLKEIVGSANPRFGIDATLGAMQERLRDFYNADTCLFITRSQHQSTPSLRRADSTNPQKAMQATDIAPAMAQRLLSLPDFVVLIYNGGRRSGGFLLRDKAPLAFHSSTQEPYPLEEEEVAALAAVLESRFLLSVPVIYNHLEGRFFLGSSKHEFTISDADFLLQVIEQVRPVADNIHLLDQLATHAAEEERRRLARDIHDSVIQPYIGLQYGLSAVRRKVAAQANVETELDQLLEMTKESVTDLRRYIHGLSEGVGHESSLLAAVRRFTARFTEATGIKIEIDADPNLSVNSRLAAEVFQMIAEGLSNVRRHTEASGAVIRMSYQDNHFLLRIENHAGNTYTNDGVDGNGSHRGASLTISKEAPPVFVPRSISARAEALGGMVQVDRVNQGTTVVRVDIPI